MRHALVLIFAVFVASPLAYAQEPDARSEQRTVRDADAPPGAGQARGREMMAERFRHREARIREAIARGDLTEAEADMLRARFEQRRQKMEKLREQRRARIDEIRERRAHAKAERASGEKEFPLEKP